MAEGGNIIQRVREYIIMTFLSLPLLLFIFSLFIGLSLGSAGFLLFTAGQIVLFLLLGGYHAASKNMNASILQLIPSAAVATQNIPVAPSYWMSYMAFFLSYIFVNAIYVYRIPKDGALQELEYTNRKSKAVTVMIMTLFLFILFGIIRGKQGQDTVPGIAAASLFGFLGWGLYELSRSIGIRHADVFGIVTQILPRSSKDDVPKTCFYTASAT